METTLPSRARARTRWPYAGRGQMLLLFAAFGVMIGSFLAWVATPLGTIGGIAGGGLWTFYAGTFGLPGAVWRKPGLVLIHALIVALPASIIPVWQILRLNHRCGGLALCQPGVGLLLVLAGGLIAATGAVLLARDLLTQR